VLSDVNTNFTVKFVVTVTPFWPPPATKVAFPVERSIVPGSVNTCPPTAAACQLPVMWFVPDLFVNTNIHTGFALDGGENAIQIPVTLGTFAVALAVGTLAAPASPLKTVTEASEQAIQVATTNHFDLVCILSPFHRQAAANEALRPAMAMNTANAYPFGTS
jgi:hypothetical protein